MKASAALLHFLQPSVITLEQQTASAFEGMFWLPYSNKQQ